MYMKLSKEEKKAIANAQKVAEALAQKNEKPTEKKIDLTKLAKELAERREKVAKEEGEK